MEVPDPVAITNSTASLIADAGAGQAHHHRELRGEQLLSGGRRARLQCRPIPSGTSAIKLAIVSPTGTITYGQPVTVSTTTTTGNSTATPTGTIVFAVDGATLSSTAYAAASTATLSLPGGTHTLSATYSGDSNYEPATASLSFTVQKAAPTISSAGASNAFG